MEIFKQGNDISRLFFPRTFLLQKISNKYRNRESSNHKPAVPFSVNFNNCHYMDNLYICTPIQPPTTQIFQKQISNCNAIHTIILERVLTLLCEEQFGRDLDGSRERRRRPLQQSRHGKMSWNMGVGVEMMSSQIRVYFQVQNCQDLLLDWIWEVRENEAYQVFGSSNWAFGVPFSEMGKGREETLSGELDLQVGVQERSQGWEYRFRSHQHIGGIQLWGKK